MDIIIKEYKLIKIINEILKSNVKEVVSIRKTDFNFVINVIDQNNRHKTLAIAISIFQKGKAELEIGEENKNQKERKQNEN